MNLVRRQWTLRTIFAAVWVVMVCVAGPAAGSDFATDSDDWNGLAHFVSVAQQQEVDVREKPVLDWERVSNDDVIAVVYPTGELDVPSLVAFVVDGGRVLLADDFGGSEPLLERLSIERTEPPPEQLPHDQFVDDHPGWPSFDIEGRHPLLEGVTTVVANYPAVLYNVGGPVVAYDHGGGLVYDMTLGEGRVVVVADPGVFLNAMLPVADNAQLTANIWHYLCDGVEECRGWLLIEEFETRGAYYDPSEDGVSEGGVADRVDALNQKLRHAFEELPQTELLYFLGLFLVVGTVAYLATVFSWKRARWLSAYIERHRQELSPPLTEFDWNMERFADPDGRINYALPVAILKESFEEMFLAEFDLWPSKPGRRPPVSELARRFDERFLRGKPPKVRKRRRHKVQQLLADLTAVPSRHRVFLESDEYFGARDMMRLRRRILQVLKWMDLKEAYERRSREIDAGVFRSRR